MKPSQKTRSIVDLIRPSVRGLAAYHVDESKVRIKLDAMENPFPLPSNMRQEISAAVRNAAINLYPDPSGSRLKQSLSGLWGLKPERTILGNGSDELIQTIILAFGGPVLVPAPTFAMYEITSRALDQKTVTVPLDGQFDLDADRMVAEAKKCRARVVFLACPNNPTGNRYSDKAVRKVLEQTDAAVVIDEAYYSFSGKSWLPRLAKHRNMIVLRTLSKIGFAGLRVGALTASREIIDELNKVRLPYNINSLSQAAAVAALQHRDVIEHQISVLISEREKLYNALSLLQGIDVFPSETNFLMFRTRASASAVHAGLKRAGILIKNLDKPGPLKDCLRVTIGTPSQNREFLKALKRVVE